MTLHRNHSSSDFAKISNWGADHVRLVINADPLTPRNDGFYLTDEITIDKSSFSRLDQAILYAQQYGIKVVIALNTFPGRRSGKIWSDYNYWHRLEGFWKYIANRYKNNTTIVGYSL
ncbi:MAG: cellulase family glycosylhydrolase, partial [Proteobacteria bacterium]|nr:cellulase family glycosylhydrolase [Pseudomonadota bacterium]